MRTRHDDSIMTDAARFLAATADEEPLQRMRGYRHHGSVTTYDHCTHVVLISARLASVLPVRMDEDTLLKGAMLHDFYLYDWHAADSGTHRLHGFRHPLVAAQNARRIYRVSPAVSHVIETHMFPLTLTRMPRTREAWIVCAADKCAAVAEYAGGFRRRAARQ